MKWLFFIFLFFYITVNANIFDVNTVAELQTALNNAANNGVNDTIQINGSNYNVTSPLTFWSNEMHSITLRGMSNPIFNGNNATQIFEIITEEINTDIYFENITIEQGRSDNGGGVYLETQQGNISINACGFNDNTANFVCGGLDIYSISGEIVITNCTFDNNSSPNTSGYPYGTAGGLFVQTEGTNTMLTMSNCTFTDNTAQRDAAGAMLYPLGVGAQITVNNCEFTNNIAQEYGGGCWIRCPAGSATIFYFDNILRNNQAQTAGGGGGTYIELESGDITVYDNIHENNFAAWNGGAFWISSNGGSVNMHDNRFTVNSANQNGGGINLFLESGIIDVNHNVFDTNSADASGGGVCISTTSANLQTYNNTFYNNSADDGGDVYLYFDDSSAQCDFYNNILYGSSYPNYSFSGAIFPMATYCDIQGGSTESWFGTGCIDANLLFVDAVNGDFNLSWSNFPANDATKSPCIDSGDPASAQDSDGTIADMGAFYFNQNNLPAPANLHITISANRLYLTWDAVNSATSYIIYSSDNPYSGFIPIASGITTTSWDCELPLNTRKFYYVTANR